MDKKMVDDIRRNWAGKSTEELLQIWKENDHETYSDSAFEAIRQILTDRNIELPQQENAKEVNFELKRKKLKHPVLLVLGWLLLLLFVLKNLEYFSMNNPYYSLGSIFAVVIFALLIYWLSFKR